MSETEYKAEIEDWPPCDVATAAEFLRAHSRYLITGVSKLPYVNSARAIEQINNWSARELERQQAEISRLRSDLTLAVEALTAFAAIQLSDGQEARVVPTELLRRARDTIEKINSRESRDG